MLSRSLFLRPVGTMPHVIGPDKTCLPTRMGPPTDVVNISGGVQRTFDEEGISGFLAVDLNRPPDEPRARQTLRDYRALQLLSVGSCLLLCREIWSLPDIEEWWKELSLVSSMVVHGEY